MTEKEPELRLLLIEDDSDDYLITRDLLEDASPVAFRLDWVDSAEAGLQLLKSCPYAVALVDFRLGPDSGLDLIAQAREDGITTPFILLTGQGDDELDHRAVELGAADYLVKGMLDGHSLLRSIRYTIDRGLAMEKLATSEAQYRLLFDSNPASMCLVESDTGAIRSMNQAAQRLYGLDRYPVRPTTLADLRADEAAPAVASEGVILRPGATLERHRRGDGREFLVEVIHSDVVLDRHTMQLVMLTDLTEQVESNHQLRLLKRSIESAANGIAIADARQPDLPLIYVNPAFETITGYPAQECLGRNCRFLQGNDDDGTNTTALAEIQRGLADQREVSAVLRNFRKDGTPFWNDLYLAPIRDNDGTVTHYVGVLSDISYRKSVESELAFNASHDVLTGLPNRSLLEDRLNQACKMASRYRRHVALVFIDLDGFKLINDTLGHRVGDRLLVQVAERLKSRVRAGDTVARLGSDEFIVLLPDLADEKDVVMVVEDIIGTIAGSYTLGDRTLHLTASAGIATTDGSIAQSMELLQQADLAMYRAKQMGRNTYQWYSTELNADANYRVALRNDLQDAIEQGHLTLHYQPLVDAQSGQTRVLEALVRWQHPERGLIPPDHFIPLAEETGQIVAIGHWVLEKACRDIVRIQASGLRHCAVAVNVSPIQLRKAGFLDQVCEVLRATGLAPEYLELEIVESAVLDDTATVISTLQALRELGVKIAIDDFGTGFSSLSHLKLLPADKIKIDRTFIRDVIKNRSDAAITQGVISMAHHLGRKVVAEGVETEAHAAFLRKHQCDLLQGYAFSRPLPFDELTAYLKSERSSESGRAPEEKTQQTLLLLDDEENILRALRRVLRRDGYRILATTSIQEAFNLLAENDVQLVISDQRMPEMSGTDFLSQVKAIYPDTVRIVLSGYTDLKSVTEAINEGAIYKFLTKPWDDQQIRNHVHQAFRYHGAGRED